MTDKALTTLTTATTQIQRGHLTPTKELALTLVNAASYALSNADTFEEIHKIRNQLRAFEIVFGKYKVELPAANAIVAQRLRTARVMGQWLIDNVNHSGGGDRKSRLASLTAISDLPHYVSKFHSLQWRRMAQVDEQDFELWVKELLETGDMSGAGLLRLWASLNGSDPANTPPLPDGKFSLIYGDPPWKYEHAKSENRAIETNYQTMTLDEICGLRVLGIAADDCVLFLWATSPKLAEAMEVIESWGFTYRTCMVWVKDKIGMGYYARQQHELLLIAARGSLPVPLPKNRPSSIIEAPRLRHSEKPKEIYKLIETMYPKSAKIELFSRAPQDGWETWGHESGTQL